MSGATTPEPAETPMERAVRESVAAAPPLSDEAREQVARLLSKGSTS